MADLRDLGLSEYEARAYRSLLDTGTTTAKELSRISDVPMGRIYDVLNGLETRNLARSQAASRPKKYVAVEPDTALDRLLAEKKRELDEQAQQYESIVDDLVADLEAAEPVEETFWTAAVGPTESMDLLVERLAAAENRIVVVASSISPQFDVDDVSIRITTELERALERGVSVSVLLTPALVDVLPDRIGRRYRETLQDRQGFETRTSENVTGTFEVVDDTEVCIEVPHPLSRGETLAVIDLKDPEFAADVRVEFQPRWEEADVLRL